MLKGPLIHVATILILPAMHQHTYDVMQPEPGPGFGNRITNAGFRFLRLGLGALTSRVARDVDSRPANATRHAIYGRGCGRLRLRDGHRW